MRWEAFSFFLPEAVGVFNERDAGEQARVSCRRAFYLYYILIEPCILIEGKGEALHPAIGTFSFHGKKRNLITRDENRCHRQVVCITYRISQLRVSFQSCFTISHVTQLSLDGHLWGQKHIGQPFIHQLAAGPGCRFCQTQINRNKPNKI